MKPVYYEVQCRNEDDSWEPCGADEVSLLGAAELGKAAAKVRAAIRGAAVAWRVMNGSRRVTWGDEAP